MAGSAGDTKLSVIWPLLGRHIAFHRRLVDVTASVKAALLLSQTIYWTRHGPDVESSGGWIFKTTEQWEMETGLTAKEQRTARRVLRGLGVLDEQRGGIPAKLYFRVSADVLVSLLTAHIGRRSRAFSWADGAAVAELLGPPLAFHRALAQVAGGINAGLLLSRGLYLTRIQLKAERNSWVCRSTANWLEELGLTRREQETARKELAHTGVWEEQLAGIPPRVFVRVRLDQLLTLLLARENSRQAGSCGTPVPHVPDRGIPTNRPAPNGESSLRDSHILDLPKAPNQIGQNRHHCFAESAKSNVLRSTTVSVQPPRNGSGPVPRTADTCSGDLIVPECLLPEERDVALALVQGCGDQAQALLDEVSARLQANAVHTSPIAYLRALIRRADAGAFVPEAGLRIAAARRRQHEHTILREQRAAEADRLAAEAATPEHQEKVLARKANLRQMLDAMRAKRSIRP